MSVVVRPATADEPTGRAVMGVEDEGVALEIAQDGLAGGTSRHLTEPVKVGRRPVVTTTSISC